LPPVPSLDPDPLYAAHLERLKLQGVDVDQSLVFIDELQLWFRICNEPSSVGPTNIFRLEVLHHPTLPCDVRQVNVEVFDITGVRVKIIRPGGELHYYLSYMLHRERVYEIIWAEKGFKKRISWEAQLCFN
jgi:hypothetical protein